MKKLIFFQLALFCYQANAQQCGNCKKTPKLALYDLDVQVPQPKLDGEQTVGWLEWLRLFEIKGKIKSSIVKNSGNCIVFVQPNDSRLSSESFTTQDGIEVPPLVPESDQIKIGATYTNLAPAGDLSRYGDYITTGYVRPQGNAFVMRIEIQAACSRKVIADATVTFDSLRNSGMTQEVADKAATSLSPMIGKINQFELEERQKNKALSLYRMEGEAMIVTPLKTILKAGESTDFTIELKDCDNVPLQGREIFFNETQFEGLKIFGTLGGTVTPAKVTTDANGKATARFTLKAGAKEAIINAHSPGNDVKGCSSMFFGDAAINIKRTYSGHVVFTYTSTGFCDTESTSGCLSHSMVSNHGTDITYKAAFYDDGPKADYGVQFATEEETSSVPRLMETGAYNTNKFQITQGEIICGKRSVTIQKIQSSSIGNLKTGNFSFSFGDEGNGTVTVDMLYALDSKSSFNQTHLPSAINSVKEEIGWTFFATEGVNKEFEFKKEKKGGRTKYSVSGARTNNINSKCGNVSTSESITVVVYEE